MAVFATGHGGVEVGPDTILVRTAALDTCEVDPAARTVRIGAGVRVQTVLDAAAPHGLALVCGSSTTVGVVGLLSGGGVGPLVRSHGATVDYVRSVRVVTGDGTVREATAQVNPELFWGLRGGKASLGIITEVVIELLPIPKIYGGAIYFDGADAAGLLRAWRDWAADLPREASTSAALMRLPEMPGVRRCWLADSPWRCGSPLPPTPTPRPGCWHRCGRWRHPARRRSHDSVRRGRRRACRSDGPDARTRGEHPAAGLHRRNDRRDRLGRRTAVIVTAGHRRSPSVRGALTDEQAVRSALCHRDSAFQLFAVGVLAPPIADLVPAAVAELLAAVGPWSTGTSLPNFTPSGDPDMIRRCYDEDTYAWLAALAARLDPRGPAYGPGRAVSRGSERAPSTDGVRARRIAGICRGCPHVYPGSDMSTPARPPSTPRSRRINCDAPRSVEAMTAVYAHPATRRRCTVPGAGRAVGWRNPVNPSPRRWGAAVGGHLHRRRNRG